MWPFRRSYILKGGWQFGQWVPELSSTTAHLVQVQSASPTLGILYIHTEFISVIHPSAGAQLPTGLYCSMNESTSSKLCQSGCQYTVNQVLWVKNIHMKTKSQGFPLEQLWLISTPPVSGFHGVADRCLLHWASCSHLRILDFNLMPDQVSCWPCSQMTQWADWISKRNTCNNCQPGESSPDFSRRAAERSRKVGAVP